MLLESIKKYGVLSTPQIINLHFKDIVKTTALRRLRALEEGHFIRRAVPLDDGTNTWTLGFKGKHHLAIEDRLQFSNRNTIKHDVLVNSLRMKLETFGLATNWVPEYQIKSETFRNYRHKHAKERVIPDGMMIELMSAQQKNIAIEVELTRKSESRYKRIFREYKELPYDFIWYFVNNRDDLIKIYECAEKTFLFDETKLFFSISSKFLEDPVPNIFPIQQSEWMPITRITFDNLNINAPAQAPAQGVSILELNEYEVREVTKSLDLQPNFLIPASLRDGPHTPDPSHSTTERGQEYEDKDGDVMREFRDNSELNKCG